MKKLLNFFNNLVYKNTKIIVVLDKNLNPWFKANEIVKFLGYKDTNKIIKRLNINDDNKKKLDDIPCIVSYDIKYKNNINFISKQGLYTIYNYSKKKNRIEILNFKLWLFVNVLLPIKKYKFSLIPDNNLELAENLLNIYNDILYINKNIKNLLPELNNISITNLKDILHKIFNISYNIKLVILKIHDSINNLDNIIYNHNIHILLNIIYHNILNTCYNISQILNYIIENLYINKIKHN